MDNKHWYEHVPKSVETSQGVKVTILWNQQIQPDTTSPNNKPGIIIHDDKKGTCVLMDVAISGDRNVIKRKSRSFKIWRSCNRNTAHVECKNKGDTSNNRGDWDYFKVIQKIREQHTRKTWSEGIPENSHIGHCTHTSESTNVKVQ